VQQVFILQLRIVCNKENRERRTPLRTSTRPSTLIQFAIREAVAARTLDEILAARETVDREEHVYVAGRAADLGAEIGEIGAKESFFRATCASF